MRKFVLFDMDGTLIDSGLDITLSINHVRETIYGLEPLNVQAVIDAINAPSRNLSEIFYAQTDYEERARSLFEDHYYEQCVKNVQPYDGIEEVLRHFHSEKMIMGVATNAPSIFAKRMLHHLGLDVYFDLILGADNVDLPKPHPQMIVEQLNYHLFRSGIDRAWMVGDNSKDMEAAARAGIASIFAAWGFSSVGEGDHFASLPQTLLEIIV